ncbi:MAG: M20/M25/M40 family metallo-hydrolase [bacterium]|nr:M20/M25/M40 family metallo-hydrolase [bacterium]
MRTVVAGLLTLAFAFAPAMAQGAAATVSTLRSHVEALAADELEGRLTGSAGERQAADYIGKQLEAMGAKPLPGTDGFIQSFEFTAGTQDAGSALSIELEDKKPQSWQGTDHVRALSFSDNGAVTAPVIFAGYGLTVPDGKDFSYDSYHGLDVKDKIVVVLRYFPEDIDQDERAVLARYSGLRYKALNARELGAKAVLLITGPTSPNSGETIPSSFDTALSGSGIIAASASGEVADAIFAAHGESLEKVQKGLDTGNPHLTGFDIPGIALTLEVAVKRERRQGHNVLGYLPATEKTEGDPSYVMIGAHFDHLGHGKGLNSLAKKEEVGQIHNGADDNASGVAAVLEAGKVISKKARHRDVVLGFWSGEEMGLLGSSRFVKEELLPTDRIAGYVNLDMVGRMRENKLTLQAVGSSDAWPKLIEQANVVVGFDINTQDDPYLPTDSTSFYQAGIPTLNLFTGSHEDYHRPSDTAERVNYEGLARIAHFTALTVQKLAKLDPPPKYEKVIPRDKGGDRDTLRAFTGTIPDYTEEVDGLRLSGVVGGGPADTAGLQAGDVIVEFGGQKIANIYDYTYALDAVKIDVPLEVVVVRDGERIEMSITPTARK